MATDHMVPLKQDESIKALANLQATTTTYLGHAVLDPQVAKWMQQYHEPPA